MSLYDAPNQQVVREDQSGPGIDPAAAGEPTTASQAEPEAPPTLDEMTKAELLEHARSLGVSPANNDMTKEELRAAIDAHEAEE